MRPLGSAQKGLLASLVQFGYWYKGGWGCGWTWSGDSGTTTILDSLVRRGLVVLTNEPKLGPVYRPTDAGRAAVTR